MPKSIEVREITVDPNGPIGGDIADAYLDLRDEQSAYLKSIKGSAESMAAEVEVYPPHTITDRVKESLIAAKEYPEEVLFDPTDIPEDEEAWSVTYIYMRTGELGTVEIEVLNNVE